MADQHRLFLRVLPGGAKCWQFGYRFDGKQQSLSLGTYPVLSLAQARETNMEARRKLRAGINPAKEKQEQKRLAQGTTFYDVTIENLLNKRESRDWSGFRQRSPNISNDRGGISMCQAAREIGCGQPAVHELVFRGLLRKSAGNGCAKWVDARSVDEFRY
jgi:hypothetical protein